MQQVTDLRRLMELIDILDARSARRQPHESNVVSLFVERERRRICAAQLDADVDIGIWEEP